MCMQNSHGSWPGKTTSKRLPHGFIHMHSEGTDNRLINVMEGSHSVGI
jgi:hypothetical protein